MAEHISNKTLAFLVFVAILVSLFGTFLSLNRLKYIGPAQPITGMGTTPTGNATLTVVTLSSINFTDNSVNWGTGYVNTSGGYTTCKMNTTAGYAGSSGCANFTQEITGMTLFNDGNTNITIQLVSNVSAGVDFIGGTNPVFQYNVSNNEAFSCLNATGNENLWPFGNGSVGWLPVNITGAGTIICPRLQYTDGNDSLRIHLLVEIPYDALSGAWGAMLTATGTVS